MAKDLFKVGGTGGTVGSLRIRENSGNIEMIATGTVTMTSAMTFTGVSNMSGGYKTPGVALVDSVGETLTLTAADSGKAIVVSAASAVVSLPSTASGLVYTFVFNKVVSAGSTIQISPTSVDKFIGAGLTPADNKDLKIITGNATGDFVKIVGDGSLGWYVAEYRMGGFELES